MAELAVNIWSSIDATDLYLMLALCVVAALLVREFLGNMLLAMSFVPPFVLSSLVVHYVFLKNGIFFSTSGDRALIAATGIGIILAFIVVMMLIDFIQSFTDLRVRRLIRRRKLEKEQSRADEA